jgi:hypothetical protein
MQKDNPLMAAVRSKIEIFDLAVIAKWYQPVCRSGSSVSFIDIS